MAHVRIDYTRWLRSPIVEVSLRARERTGLKLGDLVVVDGEDGIPERKARVLSIEGATVQLEFVDPLPERREPHASTVVRSIRESTNCHFLRFSSGYG